MGEMGDLRGRLVLVKYSPQLVFGSKNLVELMWLHAVEGSSFELPDTQVEGPPARVPLGL